MENNEKDYEEIILKVPKGYGIKERYPIKDGDKIISYEYKKGNAGVFIDPETKKPANGILKDYYDNGNLRCEGIVANGEIVGKFYAYHDNGNLAEFRQFVKGRKTPDGLFVYYGCNSGKMSEIIFYGKPIEGTDIFKRTIIRYNSEGKIIYENY